MSNNVRYDTWDKERLICRVRQLEMEIRHRDAAAKKAVTLTHSAPSTPGGDSSSAVAAPPPAKKRKKGAANIDPSRYSYRYVALRLAYLGKNYNGFEHQQSAVQATIESELWSALTKACLIFPPGEDIDQIDFNYKELDYSKCGRTDKGVSAFGQVIGLRLRSSKPLPKTAAQLEEEARKKAEALQEKQKQQQQDGQGDVSMEDAAAEQQQQQLPSPPPAPKPWDPIKDELPYCKTLNRLLPPDIRILAWCPSTPEGFSARFSCTERQYRYYFTQPAFAPAPEGLTPPKGPSQPRKKKDAAPPPPPRPKVGYLDIDAMRAAAKKFEGLHDFRNFCKVDGGKQLTNFMRRMFEADIVEVDDVASAVPYLSGAAFAQPETAAHGGGDGGGGGGVTPKVYYLHVRGSAFLWHQIRHMVSVLFLVGQGLERPEVVDELLDVERHPRKPNYGLAHEVPLVLWDCIFPTDRSVPEGQQADGMAWVWEAGENKYGAGGLVDVLWAGWREKKMDELLANRLLDLVSLQGCPEADPAQNVKWNVLQKVYVGGNEGRLAGEHLPLMKRKVVPSPMEINDRWAQRMGYGSSEELLKEENWRVSLAKDRRARREGGSGTATPAVQEPEA
ncbi:tRNA pseudouridine synthase 3 [Verticillium nonalfalfae]|uniref:tRNA pseudouridine synthase 3 n=1 Tax=Verticillium nonalfalfae TaxID=1051616 RepID=A0A3M9YC33_9PEZI|nr:tRNA pseudouridine synthase 3 [Verticillium nonalfalfae]RNJ57695.1 tRNA pseudouridine synthase 3 [Verticillium nonalfalfae]